MYVSFCVSIIKIISNKFKCFKYNGDLRLKIKFPSSICKGREIEDLTLISLPIEGALEIDLIQSYLPLQISLPTDFSLVTRSSIPDLYVNPVRFQSIMEIRGISIWYMTFMLIGTRLSCDLQFVLLEFRECYSIIQFYWNDKQYTTCHMSQYCSNTNKYKAIYYFLR